MSNTKPTDRSSTPLTSTQGQEPPSSPSASEQPPKPSTSKPKSNTKPPPSVISAFDMTFPTDTPFFNSEGPRPHSMATAAKSVDQEWRDEGWYFVPPEVDSDGGPVFAEAGENGQDKEKWTGFRPPKEEEEE